MFNSCKQDFQAGVKLFERKQYRKSAEKFKRSLERATRQGLLKNRIDCLIAYAESIYFCGQQDEALFLISSALEESTRMFSDEDERLHHALTLWNAGRAHLFTTGDYSKSRQLFGECVDIMRGYPSSVLTDFIPAYLGLWDSMNQLGEYTESLDLCEEALRFCAEAAGENDVSIVVFLLLSLITQQRMGLDFEASDQFDKLAQRLSEPDRYLQTDRVKLRKLVVDRINIPNFCDALMANQRPRF